MAMLVKKTNKYNNLVRTLVFLPFVLSLVLSAITWTYIYSNVIYRYFSIPTPLGASRRVMAGLAFIAIWRDSGYCMVIFIAALQGVPKSYYEAASIEGAGWLRQFRSVTIPLIVPAFTANITLLLSWGLKMFDYSMVATGGGPGRGSETVAMIVYKNIFEYYKAGYGQAVSIVMTLAIFIVTASIAGYIRKREIEL
jgi:raffinose/stachyose/melibiose transport system permease protein